MVVTYILIAIAIFIVLTETVKMIVRRTLGVSKRKIKPFRPYRINDRHGSIIIWIRLTAAFIGLFVFPLASLLSNIHFLYYFISLIVTYSIIELLTTAHFEYWHSNTPRRAFVTLSEAGMILLAGILFFVFNVPESLAEYKD
ncbi:hypothetical protein ACKXGF_03440 [Alkalibacillus sp. S2W]|uniref:hypothetical protein n=1 Tax=Alkalibacillus TaxID=331654 RepID=UPI001423610A|nr:hypothetical protein [Alkalibacillus almallahensis]NIK11634.1 hypothetical protein [Alkalibacillus almallahensis]